MPHLWPALVFVVTPRREDDAMASVDGMVVELAGRQGGLVRRSQLGRLGITAKVVRRLERDGIVHLVTVDVLAVGSGSLDFDQRYRAALWQAGDRAALSHAAAAVRWAFPQIAPGAVEVVVPHGSTVPRATIGRVHVSRNLAPHDVVRHEGLAMTSPRRTVLDLAPRLGPEHLTRILLDLRRRSLLDLESLATELGVASHPGVAGVVRLERLVDRLVAAPPGDSWLEDEFLDILVRSGRRLPETQVALVVDGHQYRVDNLWLPERFVVELDGHEFHSTRPDRRRDAERAARITGAGYGVVVFTYEDVVDRPGYVGGVVDHHLAIRRPR